MKLYISHKNYFHFLKIKIIILHIHVLGDLLKDMDIAYDPRLYRSKVERKYS